MSKFQCTVPFRTIKKRSEFLGVSARNKRFVAPGFVVLCNFNDTNEIAVGYTASKKVGNAVLRAKAKRRMRAVVDELVRLNPNFSTEGLTFVMIARKPVIDLPYDTMLEDMKKILEEAKCAI